MGTISECKLDAMYSKIFGVNSYMYHSLNTVSMLSVKLRNSDPWKCQEWVVKICCRLLWLQFCPPWKVLFAQQYSCEFMKSITTYIVGMAYKIKPAVIFQASAVFLKCSLKITSHYYSERSSWLYFWNMMRLFLPGILHCFLFITRP